MDKELYTIGHSSHQIERFIDLLKMHAITAIGDVRSQPYSRHNPQFNREKLQPRLKENTIAYVFLGSELGARSNDMSCYSKGKVQFSCLSQTSAFKEGIKRVKACMDSYRVALLCAEKDPLVCHRTILICRHLRNEGFFIKHILADGSLETNAELEERLMKQLNIPHNDLFMDHEQLVNRAYDIQSDKIAYVAEEKQK
jgi:uncharacterized protein (DUF488 family)